MRTPFAVTVVVVLVAGLSGCTLSSSSPSQSSPSTTSATGAAAPSGAGSSTPTTGASTAAERRLAEFDKAAKAAISRYGHPTGAQFIAAEVEAGFDQSLMQVTGDRTSANLTPGSILFSALVGDTCLIGQFGDEVDGYHSTTARPIATGQCLIGDTAPVG